MKTKVYHSIVWVFFFRKTAQEMKKLQRKAAPFLQAMEDIRLSAMHTRNRILIEELFENRGKDYINRITKRYNSEDLWWISILAFLSLDFSFLGHPSSRDTPTCIWRPSETPRITGLLPMDDTTKARIVSTFKAWKD